MKIINKFDEFFINIFNRGIKNKFLDKFMRIATEIGGAIGNSIIAGIIFIIGFFLKNEYLYIGFQLLISLAIIQSIVHIIKVIVKRTRPYEVEEGLNTYGIIMKDYSFPSGHTSASFTLATVISLNSPNLAIPAYIYASIVGLSRIYLGVHYPSDVLFGGLFGTIMSFIIHYNLIDKVMVILDYLPA